MSWATNDMTILMADDDLDDYCLVKDAMMENGMHNDFRHVSDGDQLMDCLSRFPLPGVILLDLHMPGKNGRETLRDIKADPALRHIPVIVFTSSGDTEDIMECYRMGASSYIRKPDTFEALMKTVSTFEAYWMNVVQLPE